MAKRICWKKGMRLTDEILRDADNKTVELIGNALMLAAAGRFGLFPSVVPFELSLNIGKGIVGVETLRCLAVTRGGYLIDANYDTKYTNAFDTRVQIPEDRGVKELILTINAQKDEWQDDNDGYEEPVYTFSLINPNSLVPENSMPIARITDDGYGWHQDDVDFVPPCLYVSSHPKYGELLKQFDELLSAIDAKARGLLLTSGKQALSIFWPVIQQLMIATSKECDQLTPMGLMANVQKCVSAFTCACELDEYLDLAEADRFREYVYAPYNYKDAYLRVREGLELCFSISEKMGKIGDTPRSQPAKGPVVAAPNISREDMTLECKTPESIIRINHPQKEATIYFTIDGREPSTKSRKAVNKGNGFEIKFSNGFGKKKGSEPDKTITLKLIAEVYGTISDVNSYDIDLHKSLKFGSYDWVV